MEIDSWDWKNIHVLLRLANENTISVTVNRIILNVMIRYLLFSFMCISDRLKKKFVPTYFHGNESTITCVFNLVFSFYMKEQEE